jgi:DNA-binding helix-hairpin-helix protein with protein kinase domain
MWVKQLDALEGTLEKCQSNPLHYIPREAPDCAWCEMERQLNTVLFIPYVHGQDLRLDTFDPRAGGFDLDLIYTQILEIVRSTKIPSPPISKHSGITPSPAAVEANKPISNTGSYVAIAIAIAGFVALPGLWFLWLITGYFGYSSIDRGKAISKSTVERTKFERAFTEAAANWGTVLSEWEKQTGLEEFHRLALEFHEAAKIYRSLGEEEKTLRSEYQNHRRQKHLDAFLERFAIQHQKIHGIGPAKQMLLASYGIDTAADVTKRNVLRVPGFGEINSRGLFQWRANIEKKFVYNEKPSDTDRQELSRIRSSIEAKASSLRIKLTAGSKQLGLLSQRIRNISSTQNPLLQQAHRQLEQARFDLEYLSLPIPPIPARPTAPSHSTGTTASSPLNSASTPKCPRCRSSMVKRVAKRGRNAGQYFWGCSRYPSCKGVANL